MAAAVERFWASRELRRASYSFRVPAVSRIPARVVSEEQSRAATFARSGRSSRSCSAVANSSSCWSAVVRACSIPSTTSRKETNLIWACMSGSRLSQTGARCRRCGGVREWRRGRLAVVGKRGAIRGCGQFQSRSGADIRRKHRRSVQGGARGRRRRQSGNGVRRRRSSLGGGLDDRSGTGRHATRGSQGDKRRNIARGVRGASGKWRLVSRERLGHSRCGCRDTIFV